MSSVDIIRDMPVDTSVPFQGFDEARSVVGPSLLGVRWLGTHYLVISMIHYFAVVRLKNFTFHEILAYSAQ